MSKPSALSHEEGTVTLLSDGSEGNNNGFYLPPLSQGGSVLLTQHWQSDNTRGRARFAPQRLLKLFEVCLVQSSTEFTQKETEIIRYPLDVKF